ncbi:MAG: phage tail length tape measure family protein [Pseudomonadota bacterium]
MPDIAQAKVEIAAAVTGQNDVNSLTQSINQADRAAQGFGNDSQKAAAQLAQMKREAEQLRAELRNTGNDSRAAGQEVERLGFHTASSKRELLVLAHELSQGQFKRFGGSMLVLAEQTGAASLLFNGLTLSILAAAGVLAVLEHAWADAAKESRDFNNAVQATNNAAGITESQFRELAETISTETATSVTSAKEALTQLTLSGKIPVDVFRDMAEAAIYMGRTTGDSSEEALKKIMTLADGVEEGARKMNTQWLHLNEIELQHIGTLERQGEKGAALTIVIERMTEQLRNQATTVEILKKGFSDLWGTVKGVFEASTDQQQIAKLEGRLQELKGTHFRSAQTYEDEAREEKSINNQINNLRQRIGMSIEAARQSKADAEWQERISKNAKAVAEGMDAAHKQGVGFSEALQLAHQRVEQLKKDGIHELMGPSGVKFNLDDDKQVDAYYNSIKKRYTPRTPRTRTRSDPIANAYESSLNQAKKELAALNEEADQYDQVGKRLNNSREAVIRQRLSKGGDLAKIGLNSQKGQALITAERNVDKAQEAVNLKKVIPDLDKYTLSLQKQASAIGQTNEAKQNAAFIDELLRHGIEADNPLYEKYLNQWKELGVAIQNAQTADSIRKFRQENDKAIETINNENAAIGASAEQREIMNAQLAIELRFREELRKATGANKDALVEEMHAEQEASKQAIQHAQQLKTSATAGFQNAISTQLDSINNQADKAQATFSEMVTSMEDMWVNFARTGKLEFKDFANKIIGDIGRVIFQMTIERPILEAWQSLLSGGGGGGGLLGFVGGLFGGGGGAAAAAPGIGAGDIASTAMFAKTGGIIGDFGRLPLKKFSGGGIANRPMMSVFGEGSTPEAYVPVPSGKIPVQLSGNGQGASTINIINKTSAAIGKVTEQRISPHERTLLIEEMMGIVASSWGNANSLISRSFHQNIRAERKR